MRLILPKHRVDIDEIPFLPLFYIAGPVAGGEDWQELMVYELHRCLSEFWAAIPCRWREGHDLSKNFVQDSENQFYSQLSWERHYMELASTRGCIIFWLPHESKIAPRSDGYPYAMDTRGELGEWRGRLMHNQKLKVVIGAEPDFPGLSQIQRNFNEALGVDEFPIYDSIDATAQAAFLKTKRSG